EKYLHIAQRGIQLVGRNYEICAVERAGERVRRRRHQILGRTVSKKDVQIPGGVKKDRRLETVMSELQVIARARDLIGDFRGGEQVGKGGGQFVGRTRAGFSSGTGLCNRNAALAAVGTDRMGGERRGAAIS